MYLDPMYFIIVLPGIALGLWATWRVKSAYAHAGRVPSSRGLTGAQAAERLLAAEGIDDVQIETTPGTLSDHYDPRHRVLRLSHDVYHGRSLASLGIAAHEAGHAMQHTHGYKPLALRSLLVPTASIGSNGAYVVFFLGIVMQAPVLLIAAVVLFSTVVLFQIVTLPVEFDASSRARRALLANGIVTAQEDREVARVLNAAAMTYVAAVITSALTLLYYLYRSGLLGGNRR